MMTMAISHAVTRAATVRLTVRSPRSAISRPRKMRKLEDRMAMQIGKDLCRNDPVLGVQKTLARYHRFRFLNILDLNGQLKLLTNGAFRLADRSFGPRSASPRAGPCRSTVWMVREATSIGPFALRMKP